MNKKYQTLIAVFCVVIIVAFIISCRKNETIGNTADGAPVPASVLQQLKSWHAANMAAQPGNNVNTQGVTKAPKILKPIWDKARYRMLASGGQAIAVDAPGYKLSNGAYNFYRTFIYTQNNGAVTDGQIVEFYAKEGALKNVQQYLALYNQDVIPGFNGAIITYDINYHYKASRVYKDGRRINQIAYVKNLPASQALKDTLQINSKLRVAGTRVFDEGDGVSTGTGTVDDDDGCLWTVEDFFTTDGIFLYRVILDVTCPNDGHPGDPPPGGDGGGGSGGPTADPPPNCDSYTKIINGKRVTVNGDGSCDIPPPTDPCNYDKSSAAQNTNTLINSNTSVAAAFNTTITNGNNGSEAAFHIDQNATTGVITASTPNTSAAGDPYSLTNITSSTVAIGHGHDVNHSSVPSATDVYDMGTLAVGSSGKITTDYVISPTAKYAIYVSDLSAFQAFSATYGTDIFEKDASGAYTGYFDEHTTLGSDVNTVGQQSFDADPTNITDQNGAGDRAFEASLVYFVSHYNTGITLLKADATGNFIPLHFTATQNSDNQIIYTSSPCN